MRPQKVSDKDLLIAITKVFRAKGYESTSLKDLSEATGLKKASLYHRYPNGKQDMAESVFNHVGRWVEENIFSTLTDETVLPELRLKKGLAQIEKLYNGGKHTCLLKAFSTQTGLQLSPDNAKENAVQTLIEIQGSLILTKGLDDTTVFDNTLQNIENRYLSS
jgi:AcrR family transcriptional regulator